MKETRVELIRELTRPWFLKFEFRQRLCDVEKK